jgi:hypothetical protein
VLFGAGQPGPRRLKTFLLAAGSCCLDQLWTPGRELLVLMVLTDLAVATVARDGGSAP